MNKQATAELLQRGLIIETRLGGLNYGCNWYAVTWLPISNFGSLDISEQTYKQGAWADCKLPPTEKRKPPRKQKNQSGDRNSAIPTVGTVQAFAIPVVGTKKAVFDQSAVPVYGNNVSIPYTPPKRIDGKKRIVGRSGGTVN